MAMIWIGNFWKYGWLWFKISVAIEKKWNIASDVWKITVNKFLKNLTVKKYLNCLKFENKESMDETKENL